jgi:hypothetical protein
MRYATVVFLRVVERPTAVAFYYVRLSRES